MIHLRKQEQEEERREETTGTKMEQSSPLCEEEKRKEGLVMKRLGVLMAVFLLAGSALADVRIVV